MDKKEFDRLQTASKECWAELSLTGATEKPERMFKYLNSCPACQVANADCRRCPADLWRALAVETSKMEGYVPGYAMCDERDQWFYIWRDAVDVEERKDMARRISRMNWTYIPELHDRAKENFRVVIGVLTKELHIVEAFTMKEAEDIALRSEPKSVNIESKSVMQIDIV